MTCLVKNHIRSGICVFFTAASAFVKTLWLQREDTFDFSQLLFEMYGHCEKRLLERGMAYRCSSFLNSNEDLKILLEYLISSVYRDVKPHTFNEQQSVSE